MNNCGIKIRANNSGEKTEILDCFRELGLIISYKFPECDDFFFVRSNGAVHSCENAINSDDYEWVSLAQLKDRVVLHRNSPEDANYALVVASDRPDYDIFKSSEGVFYSFAENNQTWVECNSINDKTTGLKKLLPKAQPSGATTEFKTIQVEGIEGLVDGKAALTAALAGETVQITFEPWEEKSWENFNPLEDELSTKVFFTGMSTDVRKVFFRIKPKTILINGVEVPAPFTPKEGDTFYYLNDGEECGYIKCEHDWAFDPKELNFGAWRTEEEIKQVVAALRKLFEVQL
ncbi:hypothetical protein APC42_13305 [Acinetobacter pittii]|uniref:hypothetical protein n=1 Tax=Acinetobacter pittii TaxID=48296 RepID=UPI000707F661|nr:hypothetical protein [Acinetobacter pittii]KQE15643.1 hypothetical protein APD36_11510 [Acinetobacter pittii]KRI49804.1 hypothetical protein APC42_13305 [Acinetobacter pittii]